MITNDIIVISESESSDSSESGAIEDVPVNNLERRLLHPTNQAHRFRAVDRAYVLVGPNLLPESYLEVRSIFPRHCRELWRQYTWILEPVHLQSFANCSLTMNMNFSSSLFRMFNAHADPRSEYYILVAFVTGILTVHGLKSIMSWLGDTLRHKRFLVGQLLLDFGKGDPAFIVMYDAVDHRMLIFDPTGAGSRKQLVEDLALKCFKEVFWFLGKGHELPQIDHETFIPRMCPPNMFVLLSIYVLSKTWRPFDIQLIQRYDQICYAYWFKLFIGLHFFAESQRTLNAL